MIVKVCGMRQRDNILAVEDIGITIMGFIFYEKSPRYFYQQGHSDYMPTRCKRAGVFVNKSCEDIIEIAKSLQLDYIQLHGTESPSICRDIKEAGYMVIKAFAIESEDDINAIDKEYHKYCDLMLFDTKCQGYGGSGREFDWTILNSYDGPTPFLLSGGLGVDNLNEVKAFHHNYLYGIDLNSKFELSPGEKDVDLLREYIEKLN